MNKETKGLNYFSNFHRRSSSLFLMLLISMDFAFLAIHFIKTLLSDTHIGLWSVEMDLGYPEIYQYIKEFWIVLLLLHIYSMKREWGYIAWATLFIYLLFDDALKIHEQVGSYIGNTLNIIPLFNLRPQDFGELAITAIVGSSLFLFIAWSYSHGSSVLRRTTKNLILLIFALAFCGIFIDMVHIALLDLGTKVAFLLGVIEDGGEMLVMSVILWYVFLLALGRGTSDLHFCDLKRYLRGVRVILNPGIKDSL